MKKFTVVNGRDVLFDGIVVARCLTGVTSEKEVTMKDAEELAKTICESLNGKEVFKQSTKSSSKPKPTKRKTLTPKKF